MKNDEPGSIKGECPKCKNTFGFSLLDRKGTRTIAQALGEIAEHNFIKDTKIAALKAQAAILELEFQLSDNVPPE